MGAGRKGLGDINYLAHARPQQLYSVPSVRTEAVRAYAWEDAVIAGHRHEPVFTEEAAQRFIDRTWPIVASNFPRRRAGPPLGVPSTTRSAMRSDAVRSCCVGTCSCMSWPTPSLRVTIMGRSSAAH